MYRVVDWESRLQEMKKFPLGTLTIVSTEVYSRGRYRKTVQAYCSRCKQTMEIYADHIWQKRTTNCLCARQKYHDPRARILQFRYADIRKRCRGDKNYAGRGIENRFPSAESFVHYALKELPHSNYINVSIDRIDNDGHYEPGNLRLANALIQNQNKRNNVRLDYNGEIMVLSELARRIKQDFPQLKLALSTVWSYLQEGIPWQEIVA
jgi:hypothetical protein